MDQVLRASRCTDGLNHSNASEMAALKGDDVGEAFEPLGVYVNFFQPTLAPEETRELLVNLVNDHPRDFGETLLLRLESKEGEILAQVEKTYGVEATQSRLLAGAASIATDG